MSEDRTVRHHLSGGRGGPVVEMRADEHRSGRNPDTELLAAFLKEAYAEVLLQRVPILDAAAHDAAWYRVAERAKELRA